jgi:hypothetical protein
MINTEITSSDHNIKEHLQLHLSFSTAVKILSKENQINQDNLHIWNDFVAAFFSNSFVSFSSTFP